MCIYTYVTDMHYQWVNSKASKHLFDVEKDPDFGPGSPDYDSLTLVCQSLWQRSGGEVIDTEDF